MSEVEPTKLKQRITSLDLLRGFALLGILIMNIISFSHFGLGYVNPTIGAGLDGVNAYVHAFSYLFADMRFMSLFSILFGAGVLLFTDNISKKGLNLYKFHYRRMFLLLIFGLMHAYLIWMGDILFMYAICGSIVVLMRKWKNRSLIIMSSIFFVVPMLFSLMTYFFTPQAQLVEIFSFWTPTQAEVDTETTAYLGSYLDQMEPRIEGAMGLQFFLFPMEQLWRIMSMMLLGMALYRSGILSATKSSSFYLKLFFSCFLIGLIISATGLQRSYANEWEGIWSMNIGHLYNYLASLLMALGYIGLIMYWAKSSFLEKFKVRLMAVGRLAFTNYILMSVLCTFVFYGHGLGLFGSLNRLEQWIVILIVWAIVLIISPLILKKYKQGPLESFWRRLTYGKSLKSNSPS